MEYVCITKCYFNDRVYKVDDPLNSEELADGVKVPEHFELVAGQKVEAPKVEKNCSKKKESKPF